MEVCDRRGQQIGKGGDLRMLEGTGCDYHVFGFEAPIAQTYEIATVFSAESLYRGAQPDREVEAGGVCLQVAGHGILGQECIRWRKKRHPRQTTVPSWGEKPKR